VREDLVEVIEAPVEAPRMGDEVTADAGAVEGPAEPAVETRRSAEPAAAAGHPAREAAAGHPAREASAAHPKTAAGHPAREASAAHPAHEAAATHATAEACALKGHCGRAGQ